MEAAVQGLAAVIVNSYRGAPESRGARGTAGSGSGARTLVEGLSLSMSHNHWLTANHLDLHASLPLQDTGGGRGQEEATHEGEANGGAIGGHGFEAPPLDLAKVNDDFSLCHAFAENACARLLACQTTYSVYSGHCCICEVCNRPSTR